MRRLALALALCFSTAVNVFALAETAKRAQVGSRVAGQSVPVMMGVFEVSPGVFETRQIRLTSDNKLVVEAQGGTSTVTLAAPVTAAQGLKGTGGVASWFFQGPVADGATFTGNPFVLGVVDDSGFVQAIPGDSAGVPAILADSTVAADGLTTSSTARFVKDDGGSAAAQVVLYMFNGTSFDLVRGTIADGVQVNLGPNNDVVVTGVSTEAKQDTGNTNTQRTDEGVTAVGASVDSVDAAVTVLINQGAVASVAGISDGAGNILPIQRSPIEQTTTDPVTIAIAVGGKRLVVTNVDVIGDGNTTITFRSNATATTGNIPITKNSGFAPGFDPTGHFQAEVGEALVLITGSNIHVAGWINWVEAP